MTSAAPVWVHDLPREHVFRLVHRSFDDKDGVPDYHRFDDLCRPVDWNAVSARLRTREGRDEATQWVRTGRSAGRTLLHELCEFNIGRGVDTERRGPGLGPVLPIDVTTALRLLREVMAVIPDAVRTPDLEGYYPLHRVCARRPKMEGGSMAVTLQWCPALIQVFKLIYDAYPDAIFQVASSNGKTALHLVAEADHTGYGGGGQENSESSRSRKIVFQTVLRAFPKALEVIDADGCVPLHIVAYHYQDVGIVREMVAPPALPQALLVKSKSGPNSPNGGRTPLLRFLRCCRHMDVRDGAKLDVAREMLFAFPRAAAIEDDEVLMVTGQQVVDPAGDALDYASFNYCETLGLDWLSSHPHHELTEEDLNNPLSSVPYKGSYVEANEMALGTGIDLSVLSMQEPHLWEELSDAQRVKAHETDRTWNALLLALWAMDRGQLAAPDLMPLHACVRGQMCRPWNLMVMETVLSHYGGHAAAADPADGEGGNLPLHMFLESCMGQRERALRKGFVRDAAEYDRAVVRCFQMLLGAYPCAAGRLSTEGRFPLHIAIENCGHLPYQDVFEPLLNGVVGPDGRPLFTGHPQALVARDIQRSGLYPFAAAAVGDRANLDLIYLLLRRDPSMLAQSQSAGVPHNQPDEISRPGLQSSHEDVLMQDEFVASMIGNLPL